MYSDYGLNAYLVIFHYMKRMLRYHTQILCFNLFLTESSYCTKMVILITINVQKKDIMVFRHRRFLWEMIIIWLFALPPSSVFYDSKQLDVSVISC